MSHSLLTLLYVTHPLSQIAGHVARACCLTKALTLSVWPASHLTLRRVLTQLMRYCSNLHYNLIVTSSQRIVLCSISNEPSRVSPCHEVFVPQLLTLFHQIVAVKTEPLEAAEVKPALGGLFTSGTGSYYQQLVSLT